MKRCFGFIAIILTGVIMSQVYAKEIGFVETFGLASDRAEALKQLIPGDEDYYFFSCLHAQHAAKPDQVYDLLSSWIKRHGYTLRVKEILNRQALIEYRKNPEKSLEHIKRELDLLFNHEREQAESVSNLPSSLDPHYISIPYLTTYAFSHYSNLEGIEDDGLDILNHGALDPDRRRDFLRRLKRPDIPNLAKLVIDDLKYQHSGGFGSHAIHAHLLISQLDEVLALSPDLKNNTAFVMTYLTKLAPSDDADIYSDIQERKAYLERLRAFVMPLSPVFNSLKANVLYAVLDLNRSEGNYDRNLFTEYIRLPRDVPYVKPEYINRKEFKDVRASLKSDYSASVSLNPVNDDENLVRDYLSVFLKDADAYNEFAEFIRDDYQKEVFAETKIVSGIGDMEKWYSLMKPERYKALKDRIDLDFALTNPKFFSVSEPVSLDIYIKNIPSLIIKIFELNAFNYYQSAFQEIDTTISLDGLTAAYEKVIAYHEAPFRRIRHTFSFPEIAGPGVYVVEFIGSGKSSRAVIRKGKLYFADRIGPSGHELTVLNENHDIQKDASVWLSGREFKPDADGVIIIPYSGNPGVQKIILKQGALCSLTEFSHQSENYDLKAGFYVDRESLLKHFSAKLIVRPILTLNGNPASLSLLENIRLQIRSEDRNGVSSSTEAASFDVYEDRESVYEFPVPENLARIEFILKAQVKNLSRNKKDDVAESVVFSLNEIDATLSVEDIFLRHIDQQYVLEVLGKNGEIRTNRPVSVELKHRYFRDAVHASLQTDANGRIFLGILENIDWIQAEIPEENNRKWHLTKDLCQYPSGIHSDAAAPVRIPFMAASDSPNRLNFSLLEKRHNTWIADRSDAAAVQNGFLTVNGLTPGDYDLFMKDYGTRIVLKITEGRRESFFVSGRRTLEIKNPAPLQLNVLEITGAVIKVKLENATDFTRLHVASADFMPAYHPFSFLNRYAPPDPWSLRAAFPESLYAAGRHIGDEYRYILDRRYAEKYPGNMLSRPELLLNPWSIRKTETASDAAGAGDAYGRETPKSDIREASGEKRYRTDRDIDVFSNMDFLAQPSALLINLKPDKDGIVEIDRKQLGDHSQIHMIAADPLNTVYRELSFPQQAYKKRDLRLIQNLNPETHFTEQKQVSFLKTGESLTISDIAASEFELYDTLPKMFNLLAAISGNETLQEFSFILKWHDLTDQEKREKYAAYACHELNFFLFHKDSAFFSEVIQPYISNKKDKTFTDLWLTGADLNQYLEEWEFSQLNIAEKILLARRGPGSPERIGRYVKDLYDLTPPDPDEFNRLFDMALKGRALETDDDFEAELDKDAADPAPLYDSKTEFVLSAPSEDDDGFTESAGRELPAAPLMRMMKAQAPVPAAEKKDYFRRRQEASLKKARPFYQKIDKTLEWAENNYYKLPVGDQNPDLISVNAFWKDYALSDPKLPFASANFFYAADNFTEIMLALAVSDLPFKAEKHDFGRSDTALTVGAKGLVIMFHKEIKKGRKSDEIIPILARQNIFDPNDRYRYADNERFDKFTEDECLMRIPYGVQVVMSNPTSSRQKLRMLLQIPKGAVPIQNGFYTRGIPVTLEPFSTRTFEYFFYFPESGKFPLYPVQITKNEAFVSSGNAMELTVVSRFSKADETSWDYISQYGTEAQTLEYLKTTNLNRLNLDKIAFRMKNLQFFEQTIRLLRDRHFYQPTLWSYGIYHKAPDIISEYLKHSDYANRCGLFIETPLLTVDPVRRKTYQHKEYRPLVNARVHQLGSARKILNDRFYDQYHQFMTYLCYRPHLTQEDLLAAVCYLLLQDRVREAASFFDRIDAEKIGERIQYDYLKVYIDFYRQNLESAKKTVALYLDYPVPRWQNLFKEAAAQLEEAEGKGQEVTDKESREQIQAKLAATEPSLELVAESGKIKIRHQNISACTINYYPMDIELLFSRNPFVQQQIGYFAYIRPNLSVQVGLSDKQAEIDLPEQFHNSNLMIEVVAGGLRKSQAYYSNSLDIQVIENYGHLKVVHRKTLKPLPNVYVKVYARLKNQSVIFYKDGYTDLRGRFEYISINTDELEAAEKFAILIMSDEYGAAVREAAPPKR